MNIVFGIPMVKSGFQCSSSRERRLMSIMKFQKGGFHENS